MVRDEPEPPDTLARAPGKDLRARPVRAAAGRRDDEAGRLEVMATGVQPSPPAVPTTTVAGVTISEGRACTMPSSVSAMRRISEVDCNMLSC